MNQKPHRRPWTGVPMQHALLDREDRLHPCQWLTNDRRKEARCGLVGLAWPNNNAWQANANAVEHAATRVVSDQQFADCLLCSVRCQRREMKFVGDRIRIRRAEHRDRRCEYQLRMIALSMPADRLEQSPAAVKIDPIAFVKIKLGLAGNDCGEMKNHIG